MGSVLDGRHYHYSQSTEGSRKAEQEIVGLRKALSVVRAKAAASLASTNVSPKNDEVPTSNDVSTTLPPESSDVNSFDFFSQ